MVSVTVAHDASPLLRVVHTICCGAVARASDNLLRPRSNPVLQCRILGTFSLSTLLPLTQLYEWISEYKQRWTFLYAFSALTTAWLEHSQRSRDVFDWTRVLECNLLFTPSQIFNSVYA